MTPNLGVNRLTLATVSWLHPKGVKIRCHDNMLGVKIAPKPPPSPFCAIKSNKPLVIHVIIKDTNKKVMIQLGGTGYSLYS